MSYTMVAPSRAPKARVSYTPQERFELKCIADELKRLRADNKVLRSPYIALEIRKLEERRAEIKGRAWYEVNVGDADEYTPF